MIYNTDIKELKVFKRGKVRDVYEFDNKLLIVATDRISCFDVILPTPIPDKGKILTKISLFWFDFLKDNVTNHIISNKIDDLPLDLDAYKDQLDGRFVIVEKCDVIPFECVVRGYVSGSAWKEYKQSKSVCGIALPQGLKESDKLPEPIFTPATKAESGHDENVDFYYMADKAGEELATKLKEISLDIYKRACEYAESRGIIIADTKFEFGIKGGDIVLVDEVLTPDSSRFWPRESYEPGRPQASFDKQFVRDYLEGLDWDKTPPGPNLPEEIVNKTKAKYEQALKILTS